MRKYLSKFVFAITAIFALAVNSLASANVDQDDAALTKKVLVLKRVSSL